MLPGVVVERLVDVVAVDPRDFGQLAVGQAHPDLADVMRVVVDLPLPAPAGDGGGLAAVRGEEIVVVGAVVDGDAGGGDGLPAHGQQLEVASHLVVYDRNVEVARHERLIAKGGCRLELDHYLEALIRKPGAFPGATALEQARSAGKFTPVHDAWWTAAVKAHGDTEGTQALIEVLLMARHIPHEHLVAGLATALRAGALTADAVALEARKAAPTEDEPAPATSSALATGQPPATVTFLHEWKLNHLPPDTRPLPSVTPYDQLLRRRASGGDHREGEVQ